MKKREYVITDGKKFVQKDFHGQYKQVSSFGLSDIYDTQTSAIQIMLNCIPKSWSRKFYVAEVVDGKFVQCNMPRPPKAVTPKGKDIISFNSFANSSVDTEWCKNFRELDGIFQKAAKRGNELSQEISNVEAQIVDVYHYIEFTSLNAREGYKIYRKLRDLLRKRRSLKNEIQIVSAINHNHSASTPIANIIKEITECEKQGYKPRMMLDLFEKGIENVN